MQMVDVESWRILILLAKEIFTVFIIKLGTRSFTQPEALNDIFGTRR